MGMEELLTSIESALDDATVWLRSVGPQELDRIPDWGIWAILGFGILVVFSLFSQVVSALLKPVVRIVQVLAFLAVAGAAGLYILQALGYVNI